MDETILKLLLDEAQRGRLTLFVGSDLTAETTGVPSQADLARGLAARFGQTVADDPVPSLAAVAQRVGRQRTRDVVQFLKDQLETTQPPQPFDNLLARLPVESFITTRYDGQLERAFDLAGRPVQAIVTDFDAALVRRDQPLLIKLYGDLRQPQSLVLSEDDLYDVASTRRDVSRLIENALRGTSLFLLGFGDPLPQQRLGFLPGQARILVEQVGDDASFLFGEVELVDHCAVTGDTPAIGVVAVGCVVVGSALGNVPGGVHRVVVLHRVVVHSAFSLSFGGT
jgi:hypothetical protein